MKLVVPVQSGNRTLINSRRFVFASIAAFVRRTAPGNESANRKIDQTAVHEKLGILHVKAFSQDRT
jgi:hypothetical protein